MKKYFIYLKQQEKMSIFIGVLLAFIIVGFTPSTTNTKENTIMNLYATDSNTENVESLIMETVEIKQDIVENIPDDVITTTTVVSNLVAADTMEKSLETRTNVIVGGITVEKQNSDTEDITTEKVGYKENKMETDTKNVKRVPNEEKGCKSYKITYMGYHTVTSVNSNQYKLLNSEECYTDKKTGIRMVDGRYCIAMGSYYTHKVGQKVDLVFTDGNVLHCIIGDCKSDAHTDPTHRYHAEDGSVAEFVVDYDYFESTEQWKDLYKGTIEKVIIIDDTIVL